MQASLDCERMQASYITYYLLERFHLTSFQKIRTLTLYINPRIGDTFVIPQKLVIFVLPLKMSPLKLKSDFSNEPENEKIKIPFKFCILSSGGF